MQLVDPDHEAFRLELLAIHGSSRQRCSVFCKAFVDRFPDLIAVSGYFRSRPSARSVDDDPDTDGAEHWWCLTTDAQIVDPTADQFGADGIGEIGYYDRYDPVRHLPRKGACMGCGGDTYATSSGPCSSHCARVIERDLDLERCSLGDGPFEEEMYFRCDQDLIDRYGLSFDSRATEYGCRSALETECEQEVASREKPRCK